MESSKILRTKLEEVIQNIVEKFNILTLNRPYDDRMHKQTYRMVLLIHLSGLILYYM